MISIAPPYTLSTKDLQGGALELARLHVTNGGGIASPDVNLALYTIPQDSIFVIEQCSWFCWAGGGQRPIRFALTENLNPNGTQFVGYAALSNRAEWMARSAVAADVERWQETLRLQYMAGPGTTLYAGATFNAGAAANALECTVHGWLIPRGNIQLGGNR